MTSTDKFEFTLDELSLEPLEGEAKVSPTSGAAAPVKFQVDRRGNKDRRVLADRREMLRFESDRRSGKDRRPRKGWEPGSNL
jgi:hypothetical protein